MHNQQNIKSLMEFMILLRSSSTAIIGNRLVAGRKGNRGWIFSKGRDFSILHIFQNGPKRKAPIFISSWQRGLSPSSRAAGAWSWLLNSCSHTFIVLSGSMACCLSNYRTILRFGLRLPKIHISWVTDCRKKIYTYTYTYLHKYIHYTHL